MASLFRSAAMTAGRSAVRSAAFAAQTVLPNKAPLRRASPLLRRSVVSTAALGTIESLMPLHSAIASSRLRSFIAVDSSCWSWLSQGLNKDI